MFVGVLVWVVLLCFAVYLLIVLYVSICSMFAFYCVVLYWCWFWIGMLYS